MARPAPAVTRTSPVRVPAAQIDATAARTELPDAVRVVEHRPTSPLRLARAMPAPAAPRSPRCASPRRHPRRPPPRAPPRRAARAARPAALDQRPAADGATACAAWRSPSCCRA
jgi:hypothetical protein